MEKQPQANPEGKSQLLDALLEAHMTEEEYEPETVLQTSEMEPHPFDDSCSQPVGIGPCHPEDALISSGMMESEYSQNAMDQSCLMEQYLLQDPMIQTSVMEPGPPQDHSEDQHQGMNTMFSFSGSDMLDLSTIINDSFDSWPDAFISNVTQDDLDNVEELIFSQEH